MSERIHLEIQGVFGTVQHEDFLEFEIVLEDGDGNTYVSRVTVRNHNVGLFARALRKMRRLKISGHTSHVPHTSPIKPGSVAEPGAFPERSRD